MIGPGLKSLGQEYNLKRSGNKLYGSIEGFLATLWEGMGYKAMAINLGWLEGDKEDGPVDLLDLMTKPMKGYRILDYLADGPVLTITFLDNPGTMKRIRDYIKTELPALKSRGFSGIARCGHCAEPMGAEKPNILLLGDNPIAVHARCADQAETAIHNALDHAQKEAEAKGREAPPESPFAIFGALLGGIIGALPWVLLTAIGFIASIAAALIALGAGFGYKLFGGRPGMKKLIIVIALMIFLVPLANIAGTIVNLGYSIYTGEAQEAWGVPKEAVSPMDAPSFYLQTLADPTANAELLQDLKGTLALAYLFTGLGIWGTWGRLTQENLPKKRPKLERLGR